MYVGGAACGLTDCLRPFINMQPYDSASQEPINDTFASQPPRVRLLCVAALRPKTDFWPSVRFWIPQAVPQKGQREHDEVVGQSK